MKYLLLIYADETRWQTMTEAEQGAIFGEYGTLVEELKASGKYLGGDPLEPTAIASTVRVRDGRSLITDGPFAEAREQLGGYFLVDVDSLDEALAVAARIPDARLGAIEVRPVMPVPER